MDTKLADEVTPANKPHDIARHVCATLAGWAYSDANTVAMIAARLGLQDCRVRCFDLANSGMIIRSTAHLVQSASGRVLLLAYRGTDPFDLSTWAVDADINNPQVLTVRATRERKNQPVVHGGFYRNQRATWFEVVTALQRALSGKSILDEEEEAAFNGRPAPKSKLEALYVTGHSLGAAMATLAAFKIAADPDYGEILKVLKQVYLFAPPMVGNEEFAELWRNMGKSLNDCVFAHTFARDVVPHLPPEGETKYVHVGNHYFSEEERGEARIRWTSDPREPPHQCKFLEMAHAVEPLLLGHLTWRELFGSGVIGKSVNAVIKLDQGLFERVSGVRRYSFADHSPTNYVVTSQSRDVTTEFGDDFLTGLEEVERERRLVRERARRVGS